MKWNLFIDDIRNPSYIKNKFDITEWQVARTVEEAIRLVDQFDCFPSFISFDHDLGEGQPDAITLVHRMVEMDMLGMYEFPKDFAFNVHSANPVGAKNITGLINGYLKFKRANNEH